MTRPCLPTQRLSGIGLRAPHYRELLETLPALGWLEVHSENFFGEGGQPHFFLGRLREHYPLSVHGIGLGLGSIAPLSTTHLQKLRALSERYEPFVVSDHLCWGAVGSRHLNDLLPLPYTEATLTRVVEHVDEVQTALGRQMLLENPATYVRFSQSTIPEVDFLDQVAERTGCGLLLDINNVFVSARNHDTRPVPYLDSFPLDRVKEIHLGGHAEETDDVGAPLLIDTHGSPVSAAVWSLYKHVIARSGPVPTLIEWDNDIPDWPTLRAEATSAQCLLSDVSRPSAA